MKSLEGSHVLRVVFPKVSNSIEQEKISAANTNRWRQLVTKPVESAVDITWEYIGFCMQAAGRLGMSPKQTTTFSSPYPVAVLRQRASKGQGKQSWRKKPGWDSHSPAPPTCLLLPVEVKKPSTFQQIHISVLPRSTLPVLKEALW